MINTTVQQLGLRAALVAATAAFCVLAVFLLISGTSLGAAGIVAIAIAPFGLYLALVRPVMFPFGLYVLLIPFDNLLGFGSFGTITKLLGAVAGVFLLFWGVRRHALNFGGRSVLLLSVLMVWMLISSLMGARSTRRNADRADLRRSNIALRRCQRNPNQRRPISHAAVLTVAGGVIASAYGANVFYHDPTLTQNMRPQDWYLHSGAFTSTPTSLPIRYCFRRRFSRCGPPFIEDLG